MANHQHNCHRLLVINQSFQAARLIDIHLVDSHLEFAFRKAEQIIQQFGACDQFAVHIQAVRKGALLREGEFITRPQIVIHEILHTVAKLLRQLIHHFLKATQEIQLLSIGHEADQIREILLRSCVRQLIRDELFHQRIELRIQRGLLFFGDLGFDVRFYRILIRFTAQQARHIANLGLHCISVAQGFARRNIAHVQVCDLRIDLRAFIIADHGVKVLIHGPGIVPSVRIYIFQTRNHSLKACGFPQGSEDHRIP